MRYLTCCVDSTAELINAMVDSAVDISIAEFREEAEGFDAWASSKGYSADSLSIEDDWHVTYHRSEYDGVPCIYVQWSGIEFIWTDHNEPVDSFGYGSSSVWSGR